MTSSAQRISIGVGILFFEKPDQTIECIESILRSDAAHVPIYVLNNNSSEESTKIVESYVSKQPTVRYIKSNKNLGPAAGRNRIVAESTEPWLLFLDSDVTVSTRSWLRRVSAAVRRYPEAEVFVPRLYNKHDYFFCQYRTFAIQNGKLGTAAKRAKVINNFPGGASVVSRSVFERLGGYDEELFGFEDWDFAIKALVSGKPIRAQLLPSILMVHDHRKAKREEDRQAAEVRYNPERAAQDYNRILKKYDLVIADDYLQWIQRQKEQIYHGTSLWATASRFIKRRLSKS